MNKKYLLYFIIFASVIILVVPFTGLEPGYIIDTLAKIAAIGGLLGLLYQFMRDRDLNEADFLLRLNQSFFENEKISAVYQKLEFSKEVNQESDPFHDEDIIDMANYLTFFDPLLDLIERRILHLKSIDSLLAYRFFLATNNKYVQERLLCSKGKEHAWESIYKLHFKWKQYREKQNKTIWQLEYDLAETDVCKRLFKPH